MVVTRGGGRQGVGGVLFHGYGISVWDDEKVVELDDGDGCTTM